MSSKKALLVISFGTTYEETLKKTIRACEQKLAEEFPGYDLKRAFTSRFVIRKLARRDGIQVDTPLMALEHLVQEQYDQVLIQPLNLIPGEEYSRKIFHPLSHLKKQFTSFSLGKPLLYFEEDYDNLLDALEEQMPPQQRDEAVVFMGHGTEGPANAVYSQLQAKARDRNLPVEIGCVEGYPELDRVLSNLEKRNVRKIHLMPLLLVAGDHALNDMAGNEPESWKEVLRSRGYEVKCHLKGLGENPLVQKAFCAKASKALNQ